jgi:predicted short-subunit dehydrogenase-like oxidoreductase (DUF2520 family)
MEKEAIAIIGAGKVGTAIGCLLKSAGYVVAALADISEIALEQGSRITGGRTFTDPVRAAELADTVFITTVDDQIGSVCSYLAEGGVLGPGKRAVHMSGGGGLNLLEPARAAGARVACIHPLQSFADLDGSIRSIPGSTFAVTADDEIRDWALQVVRDLGGVSFFLADEDKPLYHAAACFASNYLVSLMNIVVSLYGTLGLDSNEALRAVWPLVQGTIDNIKNNGVDDALTGPVVRGDVMTIRSHLDVLAAKAPETLPLYRALGRAALGIAVKNRRISEEKSAELDALLKGDDLK